MARIRIEAIIEKLEDQLKRALEDAVNHTIENAVFDRNRLFREFKRAVGQKCSDWEIVNDADVEES